MIRLTRDKLLPPVNSIFPALLSGVLLLLAFPTFSVPGISAIALVPLLTVLLRGGYSRAESFRIGYLFGCTFFILLLWWVKDLLPWANVTVPWLMTPALICAVLFLALYPAFFALLLRWIGGGRVRESLLIAPALWTVLEIIRSRGEIGFPWGVVGYSGSDFPRIIQVASLVGVYGVSFIIVAVNCLFTAALLSRRFLHRLLFAAAGLLVISAMLVVGGRLMKPAAEPAASVTVAVMQPNIDLKIKWNPAFTDSIFSSFAQQCRAVLPLDPVLYIFPETAAPVYIKFEPRYRQRIARMASELRTPVFIGYLDARKDAASGEMNIFNAAGLFDSDGRLASQYEKTHLLPFGEALPLSWKFPILKKINFGQGNFHPGSSTAAIRFSDHSFGTLICFESIFPELSRRYAMNGADFFVNITNDGWFGDTPGPVQHAQMCIMRAVENRRYLVRSANTGISMIVDPWGRVVASVELDRAGSIVKPIALMNETTFYTRHGEMPVLAVSFLLILLGIIRTSIRRLSPTAPKSAGARRSQT